MISASSFEPLTAAEGGPSNVIRSGETIKRPAQPWTGTIHALLRHLEDVGFAGSPRVVGDGLDADGNEVLTYIDGSIVHPRAWSNDGIAQVGMLLRELHTATASFRPPPDAVWQPWWMHRTGPDSVIGHCDAGPWHTIARDGKPVAFVDWTLAGPVERLDEVIAAAWWHAQLHDDDIADRHGLPDAAPRAGQLRLFLDGYELPRADRRQLVSRMIEFAIRDCSAEAIRAGITPGSTNPAPLWALAWRARAAGWMIRHRTLLERAVTGQSEHGRGPSTRRRPRPPQVVAPGHMPGYDGVVNDYFLVRTAAFRPQGTMSDDELAAENISELRWQSLRDIVAYRGPDLFGPRDLGTQLIALRTHGVPAEPVVLGL